MGGVLGVKVCFFGWGVFLGWGVFRVGGGVFMG